MHVLLLCLVRLLGVVHTTFRVKKEISRKVIQRSALSVGRFEWHRRWEKWHCLGGNSLLQWFGSLPLNDCRTLMEGQNICKQNAPAAPYTRNLLQCAGSWLLFTGHRSNLESALRERRRKSHQTAQESFKLQLKER